MKKHTTDKFLIGSWVSFYSFETDSYQSQLDRMHEAGLNFNIFPIAFGGGMDTPEACDLVEQQYAARDMYYFMNGGLSEEGMTRGVELARGKEHCIGYHLKDEPTSSELPEMGSFARAYRDADGERYPFVNLFPSYAGPERMEGSYYEYCSRFVHEAGAENIEYLSHDFYPFHLSNTDQAIFADMEVMRRVALENGRLRTHAFPQSSAWNGIRMPNIDEMRWNVYAYLAYGFKALSWFNLVCPGSSDTEGEGFRDSIIYRDGTIRNPRLFEDFSGLNHEVLALGDTLMKLDTIHAYHTRSEGLAGVERLPADWMITPVGEENFIISQMVTAEGDETYVMIFNKSWEESVSASFRVSAYSGIETIEYVSPFNNGNGTSPVMVQDGVFTETFRPGEGKLYKLNGKLSHRVLPLDSAHTRLDVDLPAAAALVGVDVACPLHESGMAVAIQVCTNKRFTEDKTTMFLFDEMPENGRIRFEPTKGKYVRMAFSGEEENLIDGYAELRIRYVDEPEDIFVPCIEEKETSPVSVCEPCIEEKEISPASVCEPCIEEEVTSPVSVCEPCIEEKETSPVSVCEPAPEEVPSDVAEKPVVYSVDFTDLDEAIAVVEGLIATEYTPESWKVVQDCYNTAVALKDATQPQETVNAVYWQLLENIRELVPVQWVLPAPTEHTEPKEKQGLHVAKGVLPAAVATLAGAVAGAFVGVFVSKAKKKNK